jgi:hypothetical protein
VFFSSGAKKPRKEARFANCEWSNQADNPEFAEIKKRLAAFLPKEEAPLVQEYISSVRAVMSADKPDRKNRSKAKDNKKAIPGEKNPAKAKKKKPAQAKTAGGKKVQPDEPKIGE